jgi:hypothetical protein
LAAVLLALTAAATSVDAQAGWIRIKPHRSGHGHHAKPRAIETKTRARDGTGFALGGAIQNESSSALARDFDAVASSRARWIRMDLNWDLIQRDGPSSYDWGPFDRVVDAARARGLRVLATILYTPPWARPAGAEANTPPSNLGDYAEFAKTAVARYAPLGVHAYEIWNEPNNRDFWQPRADVGRYAQMLKEASAAIRAVDNEAFIVSGGTSPALDEGGNIAPVTFLQQLYASGAKGAFDAVGHHPYCYPAAPGDELWWSAWHQMNRPEHSLRTVMTANGDSEKQIWATEFGAPTNGPLGSFVAESTQAAMVARAYKLFDSYAWAGPLFWYAARDLGTSQDTRENFFGLLRNDFSPKPAFETFRALAGT